MKYEAMLCKHILNRVWNVICNCLYRCSLRLSLSSANNSSTSLSCITPKPLCRFSGCYILSFSVKSFQLSRSSKVMLSSSFWRVFAKSKRYNYSSAPVTGPFTSMVLDVWQWHYVYYINLIREEPWLQKGLGYSFNSSLKIRSLIRDVFVKRLFN